MSANRITRFCMKQILTARGGTVELRSEYSDGSVVIDTHTANSARVLGEQFVRASRTKPGEVFEMILTHDWASASETEAP